MAASRSIDEIKGLVAKLLAKEESARELGNQAEAETFADKVQQLMLMYELSMDDVRKKEVETIEVITEDYDTGEMTGRHESNWVVSLYNACSYTNFCKILVVGGGASTKIKIIGARMNIDFLHYMIMTLVPKIRELSRKTYADKKGVVTEKRNTFIRGFLKGCAHGIQTKLSLQRHLEKTTQQQVAALVIQKERKLDDYISTNFPRLRSSSTRSLSGKGGYAAGMATGKDMDLSIKSRGTGGTKLLGS